jgi:hypothetical protein
MFLLAVVSLTVAIIILAIDNLMFAKHLLSKGGKVMNDVPFLERV